MLPDVRLNVRGSVAFARLSALSLAMLAGCGDDASTDGAGGSASSSNGSTATSSTGTGDPPVPPASPKALVKLKTGDRFAADLARALELDRSEVCLELGRYDCVGVHGVVMGNADPYLSALYEPLDATTASSPIAYERVALSSCIARVDRDLGASAPRVFAGLPAGGGVVPADAATTLRPIAASLVERLLSRVASEDEIEAIVGRYQTIAAIDAAKPGRSWAIASCVAVATSIENVFY